MSLTNLTSQDLQKISKLIERKESLQSQVTELDRQLASYEGSPSASPVAAAPAPARRGRKPKAKTAAPTAAFVPPARRGKPSRRGQLKAGISQALQSAGKGGMSIKELAQKLGTKYGNVSVWFQSTGKGIPAIQKVGPARFAWIK